LHDPNFKPIERGITAELARQKSANSEIIYKKIVEKSFTMTLQAQIWPVLRDYIRYMNNKLEQSERTDLGQFRFTEVKLKYPHVKSYLT
jgi:hypothetical protein